MLIASNSGDRLELEIVGYQFPETSDEYWDSNWLVIRVGVKTPRGSWTASDPSLLTTDVASIADWFDAIAQGSVDGRTHLDFMEPNLAFELLDASKDGVLLRVWFEAELRPTWAPSDEIPARDLCADLDVTREDLRAASEALRRQLKQFPFRAT